MKITCQSCQSKYTVSDEKVQGKTVKIKCRKCGATIVVNSSGATTGSVAEPAPVSQGGGGGGGDGAYLVNVGDGDQRSMSLAEIVNAYRQGVVNAETYVWADGMNDWLPIAQVDAINAAGGGGAPAPSAPPPRPSQPVPAAAAASSPSEPPRAAVRRDTGRRGPDLFGGGAGMAVQSAAEPANAAPPHFNGSAAGNDRMTGQREENSVLFSLSALTAKAAPAAPSSPGKTTATKDDSGLIDLKALAASASAPQQQAPAVAHVPDQVGGLFPLGAPPVVAAPVAAPGSIAPPAAKSKAPIFIAVGGVVAVLAIVGAFLAMKGSPPPPQPQIVYVTAPAPETPPAPTATATVAAADTATAAPTASASASATAKAVAHGGGSHGPVPSKGSSPPPPPKDTGPKPTVPKGGNCGCAPGDLMCAMNCSAKGH